MEDESDLIHRVNPRTSFGWFLIGLFVKTKYMRLKSNDSDSDSTESSEVLTPDAPRMRRNATSFGSFSSTASV